MTDKITVEKRIDSAAGITFWLNVGDENAGKLASLINSACDSWNGVGAPLFPKEIIVEKDYGQRRNFVGLVNFEGKRYVVKCFAPGSPFKKLIYGLFSKTKAERAFTNAVKLMEAGFQTAMPIAAGCHVSSGMLRSSWFVAEFLDWHLVSDFRNPVLSAEQRRVIMQALSQYMVKLHAAGVMPGDFNIGNVFFQATPDFYERTPDLSQISDFSLIDINRMSFGKIPDIRHAMKNFDQLGVSEEEYDFLLLPYAFARGWSLKECDLWIRHYRNQERWKRRVKKLLRL